MELQDIPDGLLENVRLIERYLSQEINVEEQEMLDIWLNESPEHRLFFESINNRETLIELLKQFYESASITDDAWVRFSALIREEQSPVKSLWNRVRYWTAAAAILVIAAGTYLWFNQQTATKVAVQEKTQKVPGNDVAPGSYKARLTLADGSTIVLDSAAAGKLAQQGNTEVLNKEGGLTYKPSIAPPTATVYNTLTTAKGEIYNLQLADGSRIWLNSASSVRYPVAFAGNERKVEITGEAYFEVAHLDNSKPFKVMVNGMEVRVLGTHFNINAYADEATIRTTLLEGSVAVTPAGSTKPVILTPGQQTAVVGLAVDVIEHSDTEQAVAWKNGYFKFNGEDLRTVMRQLERWYDVEVVYEGNVPERHFSGKLPRNAKASQVLNALEKVEVHFRIEGKKIIVMP